MPNLAPMLRVAYPRLDKLAGTDLASWPTISPYGTNILLVYINLAKILIFKYIIDLNNFGAQNLGAKIKFFLGKFKINPDHVGHSQFFHPILYVRLNEDISVCSNMPDIFLHIC